MKFDPEYNSYTFSNDEILTILQSMNYSLAINRSLLCAEKDAIKSLLSGFKSSVCVNYYTGPVDTGQVHSSRF